MSNLHHRHLTDLLDRYLTAKEAVIQAGYVEEIDWQDRLHVETLTESDFLREGAWVILNAGMREAVVRRLFDAISEAFEWWRSASAIVTSSACCITRAASVFNHQLKLKAIQSLALTVHERGFEEVRGRVMAEGVDYLETLAFIGPVTRYHFAKNIGLDVAKPDRHLVRIARATGFASPHELCEAIGYCTGERVAVIDVVLWRFATIEPEYEHLFACSRLIRGAVMA
jgi:hypothetical protein